LIYPTPPQAWYICYIGQVFAIITLGLLKGKFLVQGADSRNMEQELEKTAREYIETQEELENKQDELDERREEVFGTDSEEGEDLAREFFADVGMESGSEKADEVDQLEETVSELDDKLNRLEEEFYKLLTEIKFPLDGVNSRNGETTFPFFEEIEEKTIEGMEQLIDINTNGVELKTDSIVADYSEAEEAMEEVKEWTEDIRKSARRQLSIEEYVEKLKERDEKIQAMLCVLYDEGEPMEKKDLEMAVGVEKGGLRGVLYHVRDNDPYLQETEDGYELSKTGEDVVEEFLNRYSVPEISEDEEDSGNEEDGQQDLGSVADSD